MNLLRFAKKLKTQDYESNKILIRYYVNLHCYLKGAKIDCDISWNYEDSHYVIKLKEIKIRPYHNPWTQLAVILHELGHCIDENVSPDLFFYDPTPLTKRKQVKIEEIDTEITAEERAWLYAEGTARLLGIELKEWYWKNKTKYLKTYYEWAKEEKEK